MLGYGRSVVDTPEVRPDGVFDTSCLAFNSAELHSAAVRHWTDLIWCVAYRICLA
jgi:hypothetical protein